MPGAPNRPPAPDAPTPPPPSPVTAPGRVALRRLAPMRVALRLDPWKNAPSRELLLPLERAEAAYSAGDYVGAESALDQLAVRFAEPRWPSIPKPFRDLRVSIPAPQPPQWDPEFALTPPEREAKKARRLAELQLALADATLAWTSAHAIATDDLRPLVETARTALAAESTLDPVHDALDPFWEAIRQRVPMPSGPGAAPPTAAPVAPAPSAEQA
ncbi:MAG: hypothetical protein L3J87_02790 [Thermoplasmata archaeon]|nr:hypothetical protein [Thermoplasmata archaeon]